MQIMQLGLKWVLMARYELILRLDGALWRVIISEPHPTQKSVMEEAKIPKALWKRCPL